MSTEYHTVKLPAATIARIDLHITQSRGEYSSRAEVVKDALREYFRSRDNKE